jgi:hypothetical protein
VGNWQADNQTQVVVGLLGQMPVKVSEENGQIHTGDRLGVSKLNPGYAAKLIGSGQSVGIALADSNGETEGLDTILVFVNVGYQQMDIGSNADGTKITINKDVDFQGMSLLNVKAIASASGKWSVDENGNLTVVKVSADVVKSKLGVTINDRITGQPYCVFVANGQSQTMPGDCESITPDSSSGSSPPSGSTNATVASTPPTASDSSTPSSTTPTAASDSSPTTTQPTSAAPAAATSQPAQQSTAPDASAAVNDPATPVPPTTPVDSATSTATTP